MFCKSFPIQIKEDVFKVSDLIPFKTYNNCSGGVSDQTICYLINKDTVELPYRIYYLDVSDAVIENLNSQQQMILHCIFSRSCNGFVREKHVKALLSMDYKEWAIPFIIKVCDEYVVEILEMIYEILKNQDTENIKRFCSNNVKIFRKSYARMISYWNEFYRDKCFSYKQYIGRKLFIECFGYSRSMEQEK